MKEKARRFGNVSSNLRAFSKGETLLSVRGRWKIEAVNLQSGYTEVRFPQPLVLPLESKAAVHRSQSLL